MKQYTYMMLKPDAFVDGKKEKVIQELEKYGLHVESSCLLEVDMEVMKILLDHYQQVIDEKGAEIILLVNSFIHFITMDLNILCL